MASLASLPCENYTQRSWWEDEKKSISSKDASSCIHQWISISDSAATKTQVRENPTLQILSSPLSAPSELRPNKAQQLPKGAHTCFPAFISVHYVEDVISRMGGAPTSLTSGQ
jgi:hypothetical protein